MAALERFEGPLITYVRGLLDDVERARDVVQDVFLRLCKQRQAEIEPKLAEWLFTVSRNAAFDVRRKERRMKPIETIATEQISEAQGPVAVAEQQDEIDRVMRAMEALPENHREVLALRFRHGLSYREVSRITGQTENAVGVMIHNGMKKLRSKLTRRTEGTMQ